MNNRPILIYRIIITLLLLCVSGTLVFAESGIILDMQALHAALLAKQAINNTGIRTNLNGFQTMSISDAMAPSVNTLLMNNQEIFSGDYVQNRPAIKAEITELGSGLATWNLTLINTAAGISSTLASGYGNLATGSALIITHNITTALSSGIYSLALTLLDGNNNQTTYTSPTFNISESLDIKNLLNGPNPFNPNQAATNIQYQLTEDAAVNLHIYSISGELLSESSYEIGQSGGKTGYNSITWNGRNKQSEIVANGPYIVYLTANNGTTKKTRKTKILVLK